MWMKGEGKSSRRLTQVDAAGGETSVCVVTGLLYPQGESGAAATEKTRVLRVGCRAGIKIARGGRFVPSSPCYRLKLTGPLRPVHISIPALRVEGDCPLPSTTSTRWTSFYPRPPHGGRLSDRLKVGDSLIFLSTPSRRGRHPAARIRGCRTYFYPRPRVEGDRTS